VIPTELRRAILALAADCCLFCGQNADSVVFIVSPADGGRAEPANLAAACGACRRGGTHPPTDEMLRVTQAAAADQASLVQHVALAIRAADRRARALRGTPPRA
jgi:hypothetical protein